MRILMLTPYLPYPLWSGGQIRTYNLLKNLSSKHDITLFSFIREEKERRYIKNLKGFCDEVQVFVKRPPWSVTSLSLAAVTYYPLVVCLYLKNEVKKAISEAIFRKNFHLIHAETFYVMPNLPRTEIPVILAEQTIEYLVYRHYTQNVAFLPKKLLMNWDVTKIYFWERMFWKRARRVIAMSQADKNQMVERVKNLQVDLVPNGVDTQFFSFRKKPSEQESKTILFVGNFKWLQNREAVVFLLNKVWPKIKKTLKGKVNLWIVGKYPPTDILKHHSPQVTVSSDISDIRAAYEKSDILLAPIFGPGGTRYKILESMAAGVPVVTTSTGIEGLSAENGRHALIAEDPVSLSEATVKLLTDRGLYSHLAENGRSLVEKRYSWKSIAAKLDEIYRAAL